MLKAKIASVLIVGSLLLGGCASKSPVNMNAISKNNNSSVTQTSNNADNKASEGQNEVSNTSNQVSPEQTNNGMTSNKNNEQKVIGQASGKATNNQGSNNVQNANYNSSKPTTAAISQDGVEYLAAVEDEVLRLCNIERSKAGLSPLVMDNKVREAGRFKAQEMLTRNYFDHNSPYSGSPFDLMKSRGISFGYAGENIQKSEGKDRASVTAKYLVDNWMNSPGHRANILKPEFKKMGVGVAFSSNGNKAYESQLFTD